MWLPSCEHFNIEFSMLILVLTIKLISHLIQWIFKIFSIWKMFS